MIAALTTWWAWAILAVGAVAWACGRYRWMNRAWLLSRDSLAAERARQDRAAERLREREHALHSADREDLYRAWRARDAAREEARRWKALVMDRRGTARRAVPRGRR